MTSERLQQIEELYHFALEKDSAERMAFLNESCKGDEELRQEVESLLASQAEAGDFIEEPVHEVAARLIADNQKRSMVGRVIGHYEIIELLGAGGMGEVYLARDKTLVRKVALKLLPDYFTRDDARVRRFQQEARAASGLNHPNILTIYEINEVDGQHFIATEFIDGQTLRERRAQTRMKLSEALEIAIQVAGALVAANAAGITHRDIKPDNIMIRRDGYVKVLDFGLAKLTEQPAATVDTEAATRVRVKTEPGMVMGTAQYMSPEQARGLEVDGRTDIWSLGVVLCEMVTGQAPFAGETPSHVIVSILEKHAPPLSRYLPEVPAELERIVDKALRKNRDERYQTVKDLLLDLKSLRQELEVEAHLERSSHPGLRVPETTTKSGEQITLEAARTTAAETANVGIAHPTSSAEYLVGAIRRRKVVATVAFVVLAFVVVAGFVFYKPLLFWWFKTPSIAVLPMVNATGDPNNNYLTDGLTESLITSLNQINAPGKFPRLLVTAQSTISLFRGKEIEPRSVGRELGVDTVLASQMIEQNGLWIIKVEMINVTNGSEMWRQQYPIGGSQRIDQFLKTQDEIASDVAGKLPLKLSDAERQRLTRRYTQNPAAYDAYLKGRASWFRTTPDGYRKSIEYYQQAIDLDPNFALPYVGMGLSYSLQATIGVRSYKEANEKATDLYLRALKIDNTLGIAKGALELGEMEMWNWEAIEKAGPQHKGYHFPQGGYLIAMGRLDEQLAIENRILAFDPHNPLMNFSFADTLFLARQYDAAIAQYQKTLNVISGLPPEYSGALVNWIHSGLGQAYLQKGMFPEAIAELNKAKDLTEDLPPASEALGYAYARSGQRDEAIKILNQLQERAKRGEYVLPLGIAWIYIGLGDKDQAFGWLDKSFEERSGGMRVIKTNPIYDPLRSDPRFTALLKRMRLPT